MANREIHVDIFIYQHTEEYANAFDSAFEHAKYTQQTTGRDRETSVRRSF